MLPGEALSCLKYVGSVPEMEPSSLGEVTCFYLLDLGVYLRQLHHLSFHHTILFWWLRLSGWSICVLVNQALFKYFLSIGLSNHKSNHKEITQTKRSEARDLSPPLIGSCIIIFCLHVFLFSQTLSFCSSKKPMWFFFKFFHF